MGAAILVVYGTVGYMLLEHYSLLEAVFMTVITVTTVGYEEVHPLHAGGEAFTITLIVMGVMGFLYTFSVLVEAISSGNYREYRRQRRMDSAIAALRDHVVVCGCGRTGKQVIKELQALNQPFVVIDGHDYIVDEVRELGHLAILGDATNDDMLLQAGVDRARALVCAVDSDERGVYIVLTARSLNPDIYIVARSSYPDAHSKLRRAGADRVVSPYKLSGERLAALAMQPAVVDALDMVRSGLAGSMRIEEMVVSAGSPELAASTLRQPGATLLALGHADGRLTVGPADSDVVLANDIVVAMGTREQLNDLAAMLRPTTSTR